MAYIPKVGSCGLFKNTKRPDLSDYTAQVELECPHCHATSGFWVSGWLKTSAKSGLKFISLAFKAKAEAAAPRPPEPF